MNNIIILSELGKGVYGTTYKVSKDNTIYALKKQKILDKDAKKDLSKNIWREIEFYKWVRKLKTNQQHFFTILYDYNINTNCDFKQERIYTDASIKLLDKSHTCIELLLDLKDGNITNLRLNDNQKMSLLIQMIYAIYLMRKSKYQHRDIHPANICYKEVSSDSYITINLDKKYKIPTYGYIFSLIDMGWVTNYKFCKTSKDKKDFKQTYNFNFDLWCLLEDYCLNGYNNAVDIKRNNIDLVKFNKKLPYLIYNSDSLLYIKIKYVMQNQKEFTRLEKNKKIDELFAYDFNQYVKIYNPKQYYKLLGIDYVDNLFPSNLLEFIKINYNNMEFMIKNLIKILD